MNAENRAQRARWWPSAVAGGDPSVVRVELTVGQATLRHKPSFIADTVAGLLA